MLIHEAVLLQTLISRIKPHHILECIAGPERFGDVEKATVSLVLARRNVPGGEAI